MEQLKEIKDNIKLVEGVAIQADRQV